MHVLWEHHSATVEGHHLTHPVSYDSDGGVIALWENNSFLRFEEVPKGGPLRPPWSPLKEPAHWAAVVGRLLNRGLVTTGAISANTADAYPDAIVCFAWTGELLQVAVARTTLVDGSGEPSWFTTGKAPGPKWLKITGADKRLFLNGHPCGELWQIVEPDGRGSYIWPTNGVYGVLTVKNFESPMRVFEFSRHVSTGKIQPEDVDVIEVATRVVGVRNGMSVHPGPEGFRLETLIVMNANGTWSPASVWVGEKLELVPQ